MSDRPANVAVCRQQSHRSIAASILQARTSQGDFTSQSYKKKKHHTKIKIIRWSKITRTSTKVYVHTYIRTYGRTSCVNECVSQTPIPRSLSLYCRRLPSGDTLENRVTTTDDGAAASIALSGLLCHGLISGSSPSTCHQRLDHHLRLVPAESPHAFHGQ